MGSLSEQFRRTVIPLISVNRSIILYCLLAAALCCSGFVCGREAPNNNAVVDPPTESSLHLIASYSLGAFAAEPSGVVYCSKNNSLKVVSDSHPVMYEIDLRGNLLHSTTITSTDLEGIAISLSNDTTFVVEEKNRLVASYLSDGTKLSSFSADVATIPNNALEGVTVGPGGHLFVLNEKSPGMLLEYTASGSEVRRTTLTFASDYSDIFYDAGGNCLWIISDESMKVARTDMTGTLLAQWSVPFTKGEGITIVRDTIYIVNDADAKMYVFTKPQ